MPRLTTAPAAAAADDTDLPGALAGSGAVLEPPEAPLFDGVPGGSVGGSDTLSTAPAATLPRTTIIPGMARPPAAAPGALAGRPDVGNDWQISRMDVSHNPTDPPDARSYRFTVRNGSAEAQEFLVEFALPVGCKGVRAVRRPQRTRGGLEWKLGVLPPGSAVVLSVRFPLTAAARALAIVPAAVRVATRRAVPDRAEPVHR